MKSKRGQVTLFMIVGILIVLIFIAILYVNKISVKSQIFSEETNEVNSIVKLYVNKCLRDTAEPYLQVVGLQGGYLDLSTQETLFTSNDSIAYSLYDDERLLDKDKIEQQIL